MRVEIEQIAERFLAVYSQISSLISYSDIHLNHTLFTGLRDTYIAHAAQLAGPRRPQFSEDVGGDPEDDDEEYGEGPEAYSRVTEEQCQEYLVERLGFFYEEVEKYKRLDSFGGRDETTKDRYDEINQELMEFQVRLKTNHVFRKEFEEFSRQLRTEEE